MRGDSHVRFLGGSGAAMRCRYPTSESTPILDWYILHSFVSTADNVSDVSQARALLYGNEEDAFGIWRRKGDEMKDATVKWRVAANAERSKRYKKVRSRTWWSRSDELRHRFARGASIRFMCVTNAGSRARIRATFISLAFGFLL